MGTGGGCYYVDLLRQDSCSSLLSFLDYRTKLTATILEIQITCRHARRRCTCEEGRFGVYGHACDDGIASRNAAFLNEISGGTSPRRVLLPKIFLAHDEASTSVLRYMYIAMTAAATTRVRRADRLGCISRTHFENTFCCRRGVTLVPNDKQSHPCSLGHFFLFFSFFFFF